MRRLLRIVALPIAAATPAIVVAVACNNDTGIACHVDTDCPTGDICRELVCGVLNPDASTSLEADTPDFDSGSTTCTADGVLCTLPTECCSGQCVESRCSELGSTTPTCKNAYELCQDDCCAGLTCTNGSCR